LLLRFFIYLKEVDKTELDEAKNIQAPLLLIKYLFLISYVGLYVKYLIDNTGTPPPPTFMPPSGS
jgi:hypothetical protein